MPRTNYGPRAGVPVKKRASAVSAGKSPLAQVNLTIQRAQDDPTSLQASNIHTLQRSIGNQATTRLLQPVIQPQRIRPSTSATPTLQRKEQNFSENKDLQPLIRKVTYYNEQSANSSIGSGTQSLYQNVSKRYEKLVELLDLYNTIPQDDTNFEQQIELLQGIRTWIDRLYDSLQRLWHSDRVLSGEGGSMADELSANSRRAKIAKDMNGSFLNALMGNGGRLHKLSSKVDDELERVAEQQANQPPQEWAYAHPEDFVYSPYRKTIKERRHEFSDRLANPYAIVGQQRGFLPHNPSKDTESGLRQTQNTTFGKNGSFGSRWQWQGRQADTSKSQNESFGSNGAFGSRWQWQGGETDTSKSQNESFGSNGAFGSRWQWQGGETDTSKSQNESFGSNGAFGSRWQWQGGEADTSKSQNESFGSNGAFGSRWQWQGGETDTSKSQNESFGSNGAFGSRWQWQGGEADTSKSQNESFGSNGVFGSRWQWQGGEADTSKSQNESFGSNGAFGSRWQWQGGEADTSKSQNESFGSNGAFGSRRQWKRAFPKDLDE